MKYSARNVLNGTIKHLTPGSVNTEVVIEVMPGVEIVSVITKASSERLKLAVGKDVAAIVKASNVMLAVE
ncbi:MAG: TOBE domain-containing protein [Elainellaceae cyanobacterium]